MRPFLMALAVLTMAGPLWAADFAGAWVAQLKLDGYEEITVSRTWLGRVRIQADKGDVEREIILNPRTGEVLRDYSQADDGSTRLPLGFEVELDDDHADRSRSNESGGEDGDGGATEDD